MNLQLEQNTLEKLTDVCRRYYVEKLSFFGSASRGEERPDSDLDILVEFLPGHVPGFALVDIQEELSTILGRRVDLRTPGELSTYFRDEVVKEAQAIYAHG